MDIDKLPSVVSWPHALTSEGREFAFAGFLPDETLGRYVERVGLRIAKGPLYVLHNGRPVPEALWMRLIPRTGDQVIIRTRMEGGGGGNKVLRTVALVVVAVAAAASGGAAAGAMGFVQGTAGFAAASAAVSAGIIIGGSMLVGALIPLPKPNTASAVTGSADTAPAYQIQAARNTARQWEPMMIVFGRHRVVPDLAGNPSTRYVGDDQYLYQAFHFGIQPDLNITDIRLGDTPLMNYQGVQIQRSGWDGELTLVPDNVDTLQGFDLNAYDGFNYRTTPTNTNHIEVELAAQLFVLDTVTGKFMPNFVKVQIDYRNVAGGPWIPLGAYSDPIYATHYWALGVYQADSGDGAQPTWIQQSYGSTNYADHTEGESFQSCQTWGSGDAGETTVCTKYEWRWLPHPYRLGRPWAGIAPDPLIGYTPQSGFQINGDSNKPVRATYGVHVDLGQYEIRVKKITPDQSSNTESNVTSVTQIRAYQYIPADYSQQSRLGVQIRASSQLNGSIDQLSAMVEAYCNVWDGTRWVAKVNSNPAWWFLWFARGRTNTKGERLFGGNIPESQIDVESIKAWGAWCDKKGWTFDYVLARGMSVHDVLTMIARAGQASYTWQSGKLGVVWDAADQPFVGLVGPFNIKAGTFEVSYADASVDEIVGNFINPARNWQSDQVRVRVPGAPRLNNPQTFDLEGVINPTTAGRMVNLVAASQLYHRRRVSWEMDIEGYVATRGDVVQVSHDLTVWGYSGRLLAGNRTTLTLDRTVPSGGTGWMLLRGPENQIVYIQVAGQGETDTLTILTQEVMNSIPMPGDENYQDIPALDWAWQFDPLSTPGRRLKIVKCEPTNDDGVRFEAVDDDPNYYASEYNPYAHTPPRDGALLGGVVFGVTFQETITNAAADEVEVRIDWSISMAMRVNVGYTINGVKFPTITTTDRYVIIAARTGDVIQATVLPVNATGSGQAKTASYTVLGVLAPLPTVTGLTSVYRDGLTYLDWDPVSDVRNPVYEIRLGSSWASGRTIANTADTQALAVGNGLYFVAARFVTSKGVALYGTPDSLQISGATLVRNVLASFSEGPEWTGEVAGGAFIFNGQLTLAATGDILGVEDVLALDSVLWYGGSELYGVYHTADTNVVDIGRVAPVRVDFSIDAYALNFEENVLGVADFLGIDDVLNASNQQHYRVQPQIRRANVEGEWSAWADYVPGLINARFFDVRIVMETDNPLIVPFVTSFDWTIDVPDLVQQGEGLAVPAEGLHVDFPSPFHAKPVIVITQLDAVNGDRFTLTNVTLTGFDIFFFNGTTPKAAVMNYIAQRY